LPGNDHDDWNCSIDRPGSMNPPNAKGTWEN
jgi:hypothetical protein